MASSLGGVVQACAALRAGITRPRPIPQMPVVSAYDQAPVPLTGHPVHGLTEGYPVGTRWIRLMVEAFSDFAGQPGAPSRTQALFWERCEVVVVLPIVRHQRFQMEEMECEESLRSGVIAPLVRLLELPLAAEAVTLIEAGHAGTAAALVRARERILAGETDAAVILAVDSYLDGLSLEWLASSGRLKCDGRPCGLAPGEAAVCLLIESAAAAAARAAPVAARIMGVAHRVGSGDERSAAAEGRRVTDAVTTALDATGSTSAGLLITDHNGEIWRSEVMALALLSLHQRHLVDNDRMVMPASSLGDTGAASGAIGLCIAAHAFWRQPQLGATVTVVSLGEGGDAGAIMLARAG